MMKLSDITAGMRERYASRSEPEGVRFLADVWWRTLLVCASALVGAALVYGIWMLFGTLNAPTSSDASSAPRDGFSPKTLHQVVEGFDARKIRFNDFPSNPPPGVSDPSR